MASGKTHDRLTLKTLPLAIFLGGYAAHEGHEIALIAMPLGHAMSLLLNPDLDLRTRTRAEAHMMRIAWLTWPLLIMSNLYARVFGGGRWPFVHRGISHWPLVGTATRWLWFSWPMVLLALLTQNEAALVGLIPALLWLFAGNCLGDLIHLLADAIIRE